MKFSYPSDCGFKTHKDSNPTGRDGLANYCLTSPLQAICFSTRSWSGKAHRLSLSSQWLRAGRGRYYLKKFEYGYTSDSFINIMVI